MGASDDDGDDLGIDPAKLSELIGAEVDKREKERAKAKRREKLTAEQGDFIDLISDAVLEKLEDRVKGRRKAADEEDEDDEPSRGQKGGGTLNKLFGVGG